MISTSISPARGSSLVLTRRSCCPAGTTCQWTNGVVGCCSGGGACQGQIGAQAQTTVWQPTTTYWQPETSTVWQQPTTVYQQPTTVYTGQATVYGGQQTVYVAGGAVTTQVAQPQSTQLITTQKTTAQNYLGDYCSTQVARGPNLPTTGTGQCGTILIVAGAPRLSLPTGIWMLALTVFAMVLCL